MIMRIGMKIAQKASDDSGVSGHMEHMKVRYSSSVSLFKMSKCVLCICSLATWMRPCSPCVLDLQGLKWEFAVIDSDQVNAFVVPGGKVVVYTGLLKLLQGPAMETQLAAVLGHEIAHVVARHAVSYFRHREAAND